MLDFIKITKFLRWLPDRKLIEWFPPWWLMRIKVIDIHPNWKHLRIKLPLTRISKNMGGSMFGGFQASLADPIAPMACTKVCPNHDVWTKSLHIDFLHPGTTDLELRFDFPKALEQQILQEISECNRSTPTFEYNFYRTDGQLCTRIRCVVAIRASGYRKPIQPISDQDDNDSAL
ncbi:MAG: PaaI family thioesterase [Thiotrichaceae bacterium]|nr:PaaI family thioesterase [Thiotrichaceae bacterium]